MNFPDLVAKTLARQTLQLLQSRPARHFGARVYKIGLRMDFTCPNRDGKVAVGGCIYCNNASHTPEDYRPRAIGDEQLEQGALAIQKRHKAERYIAYFQSYTNTYDSVAKLERLYREALAFPGVVGLPSRRGPIASPMTCSICSVILSQQTYFWLEIGLESMYDRTLAMGQSRPWAEGIHRRGRARQSRELRICTHLILGFPGRKPRRHA